MTPHERDLARRRARHALERAVRVAIHVASFGEYARGKL